MLGRSPWWAAGQGGLIAAYSSLMLHQVTKEHKASSVINGLLLPPQLQSSLSKLLARNIHQCWEVSWVVGWWPPLSGHALTLSRMRQGLLGGISQSIFWNVTFLWFGFVFPRSVCRNRTMMLSQQPTGELSHVCRACSGGFLQWNYLLNY